MNSSLRIAASCTLAVFFFVLSALPSGCSEESSGTTGRRISLEVKIAAADSKPFTNAKGWDVVLTKAILSTGALYFYDGDTLFAGARPRGWTLVKRAFAHPGHYVPGRAMGEMRAPSSADLLTGATLGVGDGITGFVRSATFAYGSPPAGPFAAELGGNVIVLEGTASKGDTSRSFRAELAPEDVADAKGLLEIEGCPFEVAEMQTDGTVTIGVRLSMWFDQVEFADLPESGDGEPVLLPEGLARNQLVRGTRQSLAYAFSYTPR